MARFRPFYPPSIIRRLYVLIAINIVIIILLTGFMFFSIKINTAIRAYTTGEGFWSKSEKEASMHLHTYAEYGQPGQLRNFYEDIAIPLGDKVARQELEKPEPDFELARQGFEQGNNHPDDVDDMIWLFRNFRHVGYIEQSISYWEQADQLIGELIGLAEEIRQERSQAAPDTARLLLLAEKVKETSTRLTLPEDAFSMSLGEGARWINRINSIAALAAGIAFLTLTVLISLVLSRRLSKGITALQTGAQRVSGGDYSSRVEVQVPDELGSLANDFNRMTDQLALSRSMLKDKEESLRNYMQELERKNEELQKFARLASHDLQEPLRMVASYTQLLQQKYAASLDARAAEYVAFAVEGAVRMQEMIHDLLEYSQIDTKGQPFRSSDLNGVLKSSLANLGAVIEKSGAKIIRDDMPTVSVDQSQIRLLFQNLIDNAIKFRSPAPPLIEVRAQQQEKEWLFSVKDNGIGIDPRYAERIFDVFERLHRRGEYPGTGIGLAICKKIVERHGGRIWVESEAGKGATFFFIIPERP